MSTLHFNRVTLTPIVYTKYKNKNIEKNTRANQKEVENCYNQWRPKSNFVYQIDKIN